jgi:hypothetical protein
MKLSLRKRIDLMCKSCIYDPDGGGGTWRQQVQACTSHNCPLFDVRPVHKTRNSVSKTTELSEITGRAA